MEQIERTRRYLDRMRTIYAGAPYVEEPKYYTDDVLSFFIHCHHICDYIEELNRLGITRSQLNAFIRKHKELCICADLCNGTKHCRLDWTLTTHQPHIATMNFTSVNTNNVFTTTTGKFQIMAYGEFMDALALAEQCMRLWDDFVEDIKKPTKKPLNGTAEDYMKDIKLQLEKEKRFAVITQKIGFALWQIQELEGVATEYFVLLAQAKKEMGLDVGNALVEKAKKKTFGDTIKQIVKVGLLSSELETRFTNLLSERNWLVHRSRADNRSAIYNDLSMQLLVDRLNEMVKETLSLLREIGALSEAYVKKRGVTEEYINKKAKELLEQWHGSDTI